MHVPLELYLRAKDIFAEMGPILGPFYPIKKYEVW
jgi:hypothetical protein